MTRKRQKPKRPAFGRRRMRPRRYSIPPPSLLWGKTRSPAGFARHDRICGNPGTARRNIPVKRPGARQLGVAPPTAPTSCAALHADPRWGNRPAAGQNGFRRAVSRILSASLRTERIICLSGQYPKLVPPKRNGSGQLRSFLFGLAPDEVFRAPAIALGAVGSYPTFSPLPGCSTGKARRSKFLWHCLSAGLSTGRPRVLQA